MPSALTRWMLLSVALLACLCATNLGDSRWWTPDLPYRRVGDADDLHYYQLANLMVGSYADLKFLSERRGAQLDLSVGSNTGHAQLPYRDFLMEYPPLAVPPILLPRLLFRSPARYCSAFAAEMALLWLITLGLALRLLPAERRPSAAARFCLTALVLSHLMTSRIDPIPCLFLTLALLAARGGHGYGCGTALGLGGAAKLWPVVTLPLFWLALPDRRRPLMLSFLLSSLLAWAPALATSGLDSLRYHLQRPIQLESGVGTLVALKHALLGGDERLVLSFGSNNLDAGNLGALEGLSTLLTLGALGLTYGLFARSPRRELARACAASVTALLLFAKVCSPQYLTWLLPLILLVPTRWALPACLLTTLEYPYFYPELTELRLGAVLLLAARFACLAALYRELLAPWLPGLPDFVQPVVRFACPSLRASLRASLLPWLLTRGLWLAASWPISVSAAWSVAELGYLSPYGVRGNIDTLPLFPALCAFFSWPGGYPAFRMAAVILSLGAWWLSLAGLHRLASLLGGERAAGLAVWLTALWPAPLIGPSALAAALAVWSFALALEGRLWFACGLASLGLCNSLAGYLGFAALALLPARSRLPFALGAVALAGVALLYSLQLDASLAFAQQFPWTGGSVLALLLAPLVAGRLGLAFGCLTLAAGLCANLWAFPLGLWAGLRLGERS